MGNMGSLLICNRACCDPYIEDKQNELHVPESVIENKSPRENNSVIRYKLSKEFSQKKLESQLNVKKILVDFDANSKNISTISPIFPYCEGDIDRNKNKINISINKITNNNIDIGESHKRRADIINKFNDLDGVDYFPYEDNGDFNKKSKIDSNKVFDRTHVNSTKNTNHKSKINNDHEEINEKCLTNKKNVVAEEECKLERKEIPLESFVSNINANVKKRLTEKNESSIYEKYDITIEDSDIPSDLKNSPQKNCIKNTNKVQNINQNINFQELSSCEEGELRKLENNLNKGIKKRRNLSHSPDKSYLEGENRKTYNVKLDNVNNAKYFSNQESNNKNELYRNFQSQPILDIPLYQKFGYITPSELNRIPMNITNTPNYFYNLHNFRSDSLPSFPVNNYNNFHTDNYKDMINYTSSSKTTVKFCTYCEEIYKFIIINNIPLKIMTCLYCNNVTNEVTLEFFIDKYREELIEIYKNKLHYYSDGAYQKVTNEIKPENEETKMTSKNEMKEDFEMSFKNKKIKLDLDELRRKSKKRFKSCDINISNEKPKENTVCAKDESSNIHLDSTNLTGPSLAEIFRKRKADLISKMEKRSKNVIDHREHTEFQTLEMKNIEKIKHKRFKSHDNSKVISANETVKVKKKNEPSKELLDRLISGKKVKMTQQEMKEVNKRLYNQLPDVKNKEKIENKKEEIRKIADKKKIFAENLVNMALSKKSNKKY